ncbi:BON domain-containing protein [Sedimenticola hydrogenitrophicus]|uniref:BON domain-containing protein n=1 Tax=Sedimenticola hydrogenitrophicus TaxID=2967975 RepID=UPI0021A34A9C|nr:BON domain-containing protein [Sedimenticola hydrogenitrophicus]
MNTINRCGLPLVTAFMVGLALTAQGTGATENSTAPAERAEQPENPATQFTEIDSNGDGLLSQAEFSALEFKEGSFNAADTDGNGSLDQSEFVKARSISERLAVKEYATDSWITTKVKAVLIKEDMLEGMTIGVETRDGVVQLSGWVKNRDQMEKAQSLASEVKGVRRVENDLKIEG